MWKKKIEYSVNNSSRIPHIIILEFFEKNAGKKLIFTVDGEGDGLCATVSISDGKKYKRRI